MKYIVKKEVSCKKVMKYPSKFIRTKEMLIKHTSGCFKMWLYCSGIKSKYISIIGNKKILFTNILLKKQEKLDLINRNYIRIVIRTTVSRVANLACIVIR